MATIESLPISLLEDIIDEACDEHDSYRWETIQEALTYGLVQRRWLEPARRIAWSWIILSCSKGDPDPSKANPDASTSCRTTANMISQVCIAQPSRLAHLRVLSAYANDMTSEAAVEALNVFMTVVGQHAHNLVRLNVHSVVLGSLACRAVGQLRLQVFGLGHEKDERGGIEILRAVLNGASASTLRRLDLDVFCREKQLVARLLTLSGRSLPALHSVRAGMFADETPNGQHVLESTGFTLIAPHFDDLQCTPRVLRFFCDRIDLAARLRSLHILAYDERTQDSGFHTLTALRDLDFSGYSNPGHHFFGYLAKHLDTLAFDFREGAIGLRDWLQLATSHRVEERQLRCITVRMEDEDDEEDDVRLCAELETLCEGLGIQLVQQ